MQLASGSPGVCGSWRDADEVLRIELADAVDQVVAVLGPVQARRRIADVMRHGRGARREDRHVAAALALELQLRALEALADLVVGDRDGPFVRTAGGFFSSAICASRNFCSPFGAVV